MIKKTLVVKYGNDGLYSSDNIYLASRITTHLNY